MLAFLPAFTQIALGTILLLYTSSFQNLHQVQRKQLQHSPQESLPLPESQVPACFMGNAGGLEVAPSDLQLGDACTTTSSAHCDGLRVVAGVGGSRATEDGLSPGLCPRPSSQLMLSSPQTSE